MHVLPIPYQPHGSAAVQSLPLPTAEICRGVWRCLAQLRVLSPQAHPCGWQHWGGGTRNPLKLLLRKAALSTSSLTAPAPQAMSFLQCLSSQGLPAGWEDPGALPLSAASGWGSRGEGAAPPALLLGREDILAPLAPGSACWACSHPTVTPQLPHPCLDVSPSPSTPQATPTLPQQ